MIAYVLTQGSRIEKEGRRLIVREPGGQGQTLFAAHLEQLLLFGQVSLTPAALSLLFRERIDTVFLRADGRYVGRLSMPEPANALLRKRQFALCDDEAFRVRLARTIVYGKILNQATLLARIRRARDAPLALEAANKLREFARQTDYATTCAELRGIEGSAAAFYFRHLHLGFVRDWHFHKRVRRPPTDPVNCVLSFLYTLLTNRCYAALRIAGLDPQPGVLHELSYGRDSLPLDLVEEFRALLGDTLALSLFNLNMLDWRDFQVQEPDDQDEVTTGEPEKDRAMASLLADPLGAMDAMPDEEDGVAAGEPASTPLRYQVPCRLPLLLTKEALKTVVTAFSKKLETRFSHPVADREMTYSEAIVFQARQLRKVIEGSLEFYEPLTLR